LTLVERGSALLISLVGLALTFVIQAIVVVVPGSVAILGVLRSAVRQVAAPTRSPTRKSERRRQLAASLWRSASDGSTAACTWSNVVGKTGTALSFSEISISISVHIGQVARVGNQHC
jgi:hypothetical protein